MTKKWAQMSKLERAWKRQNDADKGFRPSDVRARFETRDYQRDRNRYYQLLGHWCRLHNAQKAEKESSLRVG